MSGGLAIFVKTPGLSPIKTRLARSRGRAFAEHWHRMAAAAVASVVQRFTEASGWQAYWAVAESEGLSQWSGLPCLAQGEGGLGERMGRVHADLLQRHGRALLIGADSPQLTAAHLQAAARVLDEGAEHVLGPADDGGFWLLASRAPIPETVWNEVPYSQPDTGQRMESALTALGGCRRLDTLRDLDRASDLAPLCSDLSALRDPTLGQRALAAWLRAALAEPGA
ncbi:TIGR04282 family arsenosugar biosynthesis glycosyltransferase [Pseudomarimonas salicorniae]|uniref:DUF2064 domain-containing protein n=1 Tax=Pseudomarimonas salicorniae TaxID=2933270 RepID=A0ABT0GKQ7_9GAMM|nr:DUF2064 domain-containing protein [Lysobacter sp. CAU 1642]MCK7595105.1 DUF2064 domain-containing protein [Lysobacter sp. CAU 1642]